MLNEATETIFNALRDQDDEDGNITYKSLRQALNNYQMMNVDDEDVKCLLNVLNPFLYEEQMTLESENIAQKLDRDSLREIIKLAKFEP